MSELKAGTHAAPWKPQPGHKLLGTFAGWTQGTTRRGEVHPVALVDDARRGERWSAWCFYPVLRDELQKADPAIGLTLRIHRLQDRTSPTRPAFIACTA